MKALAPLVLLLLLCPPFLAHAREWNGIAPGKATASTVKKRFGEPTQTKKKGETTILSYSGEKAIEGTRQTNFYVGAGGVVHEIHVFPKARIDLETVVNTFGKKFVKRMTDTFRTYLFYEGQGLVVFLDEEGKAVYSIVFTEARGGG
ncbi:MAG: hypothetical protein D6729_04860 [Deltaproteobacteria bacterium]|nr:MAG: hypothetical protein D6729_04860 [Deltaproteobacteria bacterium]